MFLVINCLTELCWISVLFGVIDGFKKAPEKEDEPLPAALMEFKNIMA